MFGLGLVGAYLLPQPRSWWPRRKSRKA